MDLSVHHSRLHPLLLLLLLLFVHHHKIITSTASNLSLSTSFLVLLAENTLYSTRKSHSSNSTPIEASPHRIMSGFGGGGGGGFGGGSGFGTPNQNPGTNNNSNNNPFGGGGGSGFGSSSSGPANAPGGFGSSLGAAGTIPFGGGAASGAANPSGFGSSPAVPRAAVAPFGGGPTASSSSSSFQNSNAGGGGGMSFGSSPNVMVAPSSSGGGSGFGGGAVSGGGGGGGGPLGFGGAGTSFAPQPHSQQHQPSSSFGAPPFGASQSSQSSHQSSSTPFGGSTSQPQQQAPLTFGMSSNVLVNNNNSNTNQGFGGGGGSSTRLSFGGGGGSSSNTNSSGFGTFGGNSVLGGSGPDQTSSFNNRPNNSISSSNSNSNNNPFVGGGATPPPASSFGGGGGARPTFSARSTISTIPENINEDDNTMDDNNNNNANEWKRKTIDNAQAQMEEKKRILKAKIEEKKRKLMEAQQKKRDEAGRRSKSPTPPSTAMSMPAPTTQPSRARNQRQDSQQQSRQQLPQQPSSQQQTLAERNALRFAKPRHQPPARAPSPVNTNIIGGASKEREALKDAVNLVGLCQSMCPLDELERRRNESDIQALEVPLPGQLHPSNWTLEDTAIKRFRRSAADFKLDVPEWVRPPEVLERTLGYLEEWIMERDRQGPDPRFPVKDVPPPPLDVYQFIWDRTRMIRKDFILQNYVGTGGRCDAKAVRCHERIARWHAMCEHQLSHIEDFVKMQSQQNMQELGQTMKTLNSFYDDALNRSTTEIPDERTGREKFVPDTNHTANAAADKNKSARGGCLFDTVQGQNPVDYNGQPLNNASNNPMVTLRLVGDNNNKTMARGTAEPEMRGIYMLLTMENEGGMEVLKYAAKLFKERPAVYHSPPVQTALTIFKTIKDMNYVKFFSILRSSSTPYLFACIMFKQVEVMRRIAIQIMSISYGARNKNTGEAMYDQYPLERLMHVLCFEDMEEAKQTCEFYNVTIKEYTSQRTGEIKHAILWKGSRFRVPKDAEKGHTLRLKPRKMMRTIESKLNGATRLAVCRGEVSGKGAALFDSATPSNLNAHAVSFLPQSNIPVAAKPPDAADFEAEAKELLMKKKLEHARLIQQAKEQKDKDRRALIQRRIFDKQQREEQRKKEIEEQQLAELENLRQKELKAEQMRRQLIEEERLRKEEDLARKMMADKARKEAEEAARKQRELEEERKRGEREQQRFDLLRKIALEKRRKELEAEERRRKEEEDRRRELLRLELEAKRRREAEERRKANEWQSKIDAATKVLVWHRWKRALSRPLEISVRSKKSLEEIDLSYGTDSFHLANIAKTIMRNNRQKVQAPLYQRPTSKDIIEQLLRLTSIEEVPKLAIANISLQEIKSLPNNSVGHAGSRKSINLLKIALICPETTDIIDQSYATLLYHWIGTRVNLGKIEVAKSGGNAKFSSRHEVRAMIVKGSSYEVCSTCDIALFIIPPRWSDPRKRASLLNKVASSLLDEDIPRVALALNDDIEQDQIQKTNNVVAKELGGNMEAIPIIHPSELSVEAFDSALKFAFRRIAKLFIRDSCVSVIRIPAMRLATKAILTGLWQCIPSIVGGNDDEDTIVECSRLSLRFLIDELAKHSRRNKIEWSLWPAPEFASKEGLVESYFAENEGLPLQWMRCLSQDFLRETYQPLSAVFRGQFRDAYQRIVVDAPITVQDDCASECAQGQYRRCLEKALVWMQEDSASSGCFIYLPEGMLDFIVKDIVAKVEATLLSLRPANSMKDVPLLTAEDGTINNLIFPKKIEYNETSEGQLSRNKRPSTAGQFDHALKKTRREGEDITNRMTRMATIADERANANVDVPAATPNYRGSNDVELKKTISASQSYTEKLERLLRGDETIELTVGNTLLSRYLRDVPEPRV